MTSTLIPSEAIYLLQNLFSLACCYCNLAGFFLGQTISLSAFFSANN